mgnify:CR=1 FL=1
MKAEARNGPVVYIASAYSGDIESNTKKSVRYSRAAIERGASPINPILNLTGVIDESTDRETAMAIDLLLLSRADALWVYGEPTAGMRIEILEAKRLGLPIRWFSENMEELKYER